MNPISVGIIVFTFTFGSALLGLWLRATLPDHQLDAETRDTVKVGVGLIATMTALILGLVTASAKNSFDAVDTAVRKTSVEILALDRVLARYGSETKQIRKSLQDAMGARIGMIWSQNSPKPVDGGQASGEWVMGTERLADAIQALQPRNDSQRALQKRALDLTEALLQARWFVTTNTGATGVGLFIGFLVFWLAVTFASFGLFAPRNAVAITTLFVCAISVSGAVFLILEMDGPFDGLLTVSPDPLRYAHAHLNQ